MGVWGRFHLDCYNKLKNDVITASVVNVLARIVVLSIEQNNFSHAFFVKFDKGYIRRYATPKHLERNHTCEDYARIPNGGANGYIKKAALGYWEKMQKNCDDC